MCDYIQLFKIMFILVYARMNKNWIPWLKRIHSYMNSYDLLRTKRKKEKKKEILLHALSDL